MTITMLSSRNIIIFSEQNIRLMPFFLPFVPKKQENINIFTYFKTKNPARKKPPDLTLV